MSRGDVPADEMYPTDFNDADIDALIDGRPVDGAPDALGDFVSALRAEYRATPPTPIGMALGEFLEVDLTPSTQLATAARPSGRNKMFAGVSTFVATATGKILLGTAVAAASVGGAHAAQIVDVPGLPDTSNAPVLVIVEDLVPEVDAPAAVAQVPAAAVQAEDAAPEAEDPAGESNDHGQEVSDLAATTTLAGCERGQAISGEASSNAAEHRQNERDNKACDEADESKGAEGAEAAADPEDEGDDESNHGQDVSDFVANTPTEGCERGQAISEFASSNAADHRQNPVRDNDPCDKTDDAAEDQEADESEGTEAAADPEDEGDDESNHGQDVSDFVANTPTEGCERGQAISAEASSNAADHRQNPVRDNDPCDKTDEEDGEEDDEADEADEADEDEKGSSGERGGPDHTGKPDDVGKP